MRTIRLHKGAQGRLALGHRWVFSNEIQDFDRSIPPGDDVRVEDAAGRLLGSGTFSPSSLISVRLHCLRREEPLGPETIAGRIRDAWDKRREWLGREGAEACRVVFGEADDLPGLVADRYGDVCVVQVLTAGMERRTAWALDALEATLGTRGLVLRNDAAARELEGLPLGVTLGRGEVPERVVFALHGRRFLADPWGGQKTGFFLDQRENYRLLERVAGAGRVLDAFCYSGAWGLHAARWGARQVVFLDGSESALGLARENAEANASST